MIRSANAATETVAAVRAAARGVDGNLTSGVIPFEQTIREAMQRDRMVAVLSTLFAVLASVIAAIGVSGVLSYLIARRTTEIGIRMALGADRGTVLRMVIRESAVLVALGITVGALVSLSAGHVLKSMLYGLSPNDPRTLAIAVFLLTAVTLGASYVPARRAARMDPMAALRDQ
jgi:ABC-type antimicrobial peptide transport system permease subunit